MVFSTRNDRNTNGSEVTTTVELDEEAATNPWKAEAKVNYRPVCHSFHAVRSQAERAADEMHESLSGVRYSSIAANR